MCKFTVDEQVKTTGPRKSTKPPKQVDPRKLVEALTPIRETTFEDYEDHMESPSEQVIKAMAAAKERKAKEEVTFSLKCKTQWIFSLAVFPKKKVKAYDHR